MEASWGGIDYDSATTYFSTTGYICPFEDDDTSYFLPPIYEDFTMIMGEEGDR